MQSSTFTIDAEFPGGNICVEKIEGETVLLHQELRDTSGDWFYWAFRIRGAANRNLTFQFTGSDVLTLRGPALSLDGGLSWRWLGDSCVSRAANGTPSFSYHFPSDADEVLLALCPTYTSIDLDRLLRRTEASSLLRREVLCRSRHGRDVEVLLLQSPSASLGVLLTCRHHACEAMASYALEGFLEAALAKDELGLWFRKHVNLAVLPFVDRDGVEAGDQGKNRRPYDHNRDYGGETHDSIYPEVKALRAWAPSWLAQHQTNIAIDLHCPWIRGGRNEAVYFVGTADRDNWQHVEEFSLILQAIRSGPIPFQAENNLPFGQEWNTLEGTAIGGRTCARWVGSLSNIHFATTLEVPYANAGGVEVTPQGARLLGRDLVRAIHHMGCESGLAISK